MYAVTRCFSLGLNSRCTPVFAYAVHTAGDCGFDARDLAITAPSARQKRQETAVSPRRVHCSVFRSWQMPQSTSIDRAAIWYKR